LTRYREYLERTRKVEHFHFIEYENSDAVLRMPAEVIPVS